MPSIKIEGVPPYDGEYEIDLNITMREFHTIKQVSGVRPGEIEEAISKADTDVVVALAVNALRRAGHVVNIDALWDSEAGRITLTGEDDAGPPPEPNSPNGGKPSEPSGSSGASSSIIGDQPASDPSPTGTQE